MRASAALPVFLFLALLAFPISSRARLIPTRTYAEMFRKADLVVIAHLTDIQPTKEEALINNQGVGTSGPGNNVVGREATFASELVLKGDPALKSFVFHYYIYDRNKPLQIMDGFCLADLSKTTYGTTFLLFLVRQDDGKYYAVTGQVDPALSISPLDHWGLWPNKALP